MAEYNQPINTDGSPDSDAVTSNIVPFKRTTNVQKTYKSRPEKNLSDRVETAGTTGQATGLAMQSTSAIAQGTGKAVGGVGKGMTRAGAALSSTGVGAIVGVPLAVAGTITAGAGRGLEVGGKGMRKRGTKLYKTSSRFKQSSRVAEGMSSAKGVNARNRFNPIVRQRMNRLILGNTETDIDKAKIKSRARFLIIIGWIVSFPIAVFNGMFIYLFHAWNEVQKGGADAFWSIAKSAVTRNLDEAAVKIGYYFNSDMLMAFMIASWAIGFSLAAAFLFMAVKVLSSAGAQTKNTAVKEGLVLAALVAAFMPLANVWPWTNSLIKHVSKHPE